MHRMSSCWAIPQSLQVCSGQLDLIVVVHLFKVVSICAELFRPPLPFCQTKCQTSFWNILLCCLILDTLLSLPAHLQYWRAWLIACMKPWDSWDKMAALWSSCWTQLSWMSHYTSTALAFLTPVLKTADKTLRKKWISQPLLFAGQCWLVAVQFLGTSHASLVLLLRQQGTHCTVHTDCQSDNYHIDFNRRHHLACATKRVWLERSAEELSDILWCPKVWSSPCKQPNSLEGRLRTLRWRHWGLLWWRR